VTHRTCRPGPGPDPSSDWGFGLFVGLPVLGVVATATLVGIPFGIGLVLGLAMIYALGHTASAWTLGRVLVPEPHGRAAALLAGWGILAGHVARAVVRRGGLVRRDGVRTRRDRGRGVGRPRCRARRNGTAIGRGRSRRRPRRQAPVVGHTDRKGTEPPRRCRGVPFAPGRSSEDA
jgi:hypothetical protein